MCETFYTLSKSWENGWFHTGDMFVCDDQGYFYFVDRKKDAIRRCGENISRFEVERDVMAYPEVQEAAAIAVPGEFADDEIKVFVVVKDESRFDPAQLIEFLIRRMPYFMVPRFIEVVSELPKTETMKTKKHMLRKIGNNDATWDREAAGIVVSRAS